MSIILYIYIYIRKTSGPRLESSIDFEHRAHDYPAGRLITDQIEAVLQTALECKDSFQVAEESVSKKRNLIAKHAQTYAQALSIIEKIDWLCKQDAPMENSTRLTSQVQYTAHRYGLWMLAFLSLYLIK